MESSLITKKRIAHSLKKLLQTTSFQKVSISDIMQETKIRRQTFYYHFADKYDLLSWIYNQEIKENIEGFLDYQHWTKVITHILYYFEENKDFYNNVLKITEQNSFDHYYYEHTYNLLQTIVADLIKENQTQMSLAEIDFFCKFYSYAFTGMTVQWIKDMCDIPVPTLSNKIQYQLKRALFDSID